MEIDTRLQLKET